MIRNGGSIPQRGRIGKWGMVGLMVGVFEAEASGIVLLHIVVDGHDTTIYATCHFPLWG